ncbi:MAG TPA: GTPase domain-containing protein [Candidatus Dormibacteraeota bacterium]|nr:GTPase domain-containing protein [Candidatus Dormibacteraeota bacterium]
MTGVRSRLSLDEIAERGREVGRLAERRLASAPRDAEAAARARRLRDHALGYVVPRATDLDAPLLVVLLGPTGAGKSSVLNTIAAAPVSATGVLRPTTREAVLYATKADAGRLRHHGLQLARLPDAGIAHVLAPQERSGVAVVDAPDIDSVERANRELADTLLEAADLCVFVTTATRYADLVPYQVLRRVRERGLPLVTVLNRLPADRHDREIVIADATRLLAQAGVAMDDALVATVGEGERDARVDGLSREALRPLLERVDELARDRDERVAVATAALEGALHGLAPLANAIADDLEHEALDSETLHRVATATYDAELRELSHTLRDRGLLRDEILRQWHDFVGADQVTRLFATGFGRLRALLLTWLRGRPVAPLPQVEQEAVAALEAEVVRRAGEAARRTASLWSERSDGASLVARDPGLWSASADLAPALRGDLDEWMRAIVDDVRAAGDRKRATAQVAALGVNVVGVAVMLAVFAHTAGLTGAELGIAGGTAFVNQKLLETIFGERVMEELVDRARTRLDALLEQLFARERERFEKVAPAPAELRDIAARLRETVAAVA